MCLNFCRVQNFQAHSKFIFCYIPNQERTTKKCHTTKTIFAACLGKRHTTKHGHTIKGMFAVCPRLGHTTKNPNIYFKLNPLPYPLLHYPLHRPLLSFSPSAASPSPHRRGAWPAPPACCPSPPPFARPSLGIVGSGGGARGGGSGGAGGGEQ